MVSTNFKLYSEYYDLLYQDKNYKAEAEYVNRHIKQLLPDAGQLLELGCGTGNHANYLCLSGYSITGIERSADMVEQAKRKNITRFHPQVGDITDFQLGLQFDAVISLFHVISYLTSNNDLLACFERAFQHLKPGGIFAFDIWYAPAVLNRLPQTRIKRAHNDKTQVIRIAETTMHSENNLAEVDYEIIVKDKNTGNYLTIVEKHPMRYFSIPELKMLAEISGFNLVIKEEFFTSQKPTLDTWNVFVVLEKTK